MDRPYEEFSRRLRQRMSEIGIQGNKELIERLGNARCAVTPNMVSRWVNGHGRPWHDRLEALLDVLGVVTDTERHEWRAAAYFPPSNREMVP